MVGTDFLSSSQWPQLPPLAFFMPCLSCSSFEYRLSVLLPQAPCTCCFCFLASSSFRYDLILLFFLGLYPSASSQKSYLYPTNSQSFFLHCSDPLGINHLLTLVYVCNCPNFFHNPVTLKTAKALSHLFICTVPTPRTIQVVFCTYQFYSCRYNRSSVKNIFLKIASYWIHIPRAHGTWVLRSV